MTPPSQSSLPRTLARQAVRHGVPFSATYCYELLRYYYSLHHSLYQGSTRKKTYPHSFLNESDRGRLLKPSCKSCKRKHNFLDSHRNHNAPFFFFVLTFLGKWLCFLFLVSSPGCTVRQKVHTSHRSRPRSRLFFILYTSHRSRSISRLFFILYLSLGHAQGLYGICR